MNYNTSSITIDGNVTNFCFSRSYTSLIVCCVEDCVFVFVSCMYLSDIGSCFSIIQSVHAYIHTSSS